MSREITTGLRGYGATGTVLITSLTANNFITSYDKRLVSVIKIPKLVCVSPGTVQGRTCHLILRQVLYDGRRQPAPALPGPRGQRAVSGTLPPPTASRFTTKTESLTQFGLRVGLFQSLEYVEKLHCYHQMLSLLCNLQTVI